MQELEAKNAIARKELMQALFDAVLASGRKGVILQEPVKNSLGVAILQPVIQLQDNVISRIRLFWMESANYRLPFSFLRFQYEIDPGRVLAASAVTRLRVKSGPEIKGRKLGLFGGKVVGIEWAGGELAGALNNDIRIANILLKGFASTGSFEFQVEVNSNLSEVSIFSPRFNNVPEMVKLFSGRESMDSIFGMAIVERIAGHIKFIASTD